MNCCHSWTFVLAMAVGVSWPTVGWAQLPFSFRFKEGSPLVYSTVHETKVDMKSGEESQTFSSLVKQQKKWDVLKVDAVGVATLELTIQKLTIEQTDADGEKVSFDSANPDGSNPQLAERLSPVVGRAIMQVQIDPTGAIKDFKHLTQRADPLRELPFFVSVPNDRIPTEGTKWKRDFPIQLDPPLGRGETLQAIQDCAVKESNSDRLVVEVECKLVEELSDPKKIAPLLQFLPKGTVTLEPKAGRMLAAEMVIDRTIRDFEGPGSVYTFSSRYTEEIDSNVEVRQADKRTP